MFDSAEVLILKVASLPLPKLPQGHRLIRRLPNPRTARVDLESGFGNVHVEQMQGDVLSTRLGSWLRDIGKTKGR